MSDMLAVEPNNPLEIIAYAYSQVAFKMNLQ